MACYAAVLSLFHTLNNINIHPCPPISLYQNQVESLTQNLTFFQHFLECRHSSEEDDELESRIKAAAYAAEDVIETHIVHQIHATSTSHDHGENIGCVEFPKARWRVMNSIKKKVKKIMRAHSGENTSSVDLHGDLEGAMMGVKIVDEAHADLYGDLERVIQEMDLIKTEVMQIIQHKITTPHLHTYSSGGPTASTWQNSSTPVFDDTKINEVLDKLTGQQSSLQIIPIVGMGGIGKTTFATTLYTKPLIEQHFQIRAWVTISQEYSRRNILDVLCQEVKVSTSGLSEDKIGLKLYQHLYGRRYVIVMDDIWSVDAWDQVRCYFPDNSNGSRIMMTTRLLNLASELSGCHVFQMQFLDEDKSWELLSEIVFGKQACPIELENIGKEIAGKCGGLPLSIAVIGGLLRKFNTTLAYWKDALVNLNSLINSDNDEYTLRLLRTSYKELPKHLKPCFLYMGIFPEDHRIKTSVLIRLWVAEGILRPIDDKSLEEVGKEYLKELIDRNLILISDLRWDGEVKLCKIHDLLRDVCLREAQKQKFLCVLRQQKDHIPQGINMERRIHINHENTDEEYSTQFLHAVETASLTRSLLYTPHKHMKFTLVSPSLHVRLLRVYSSVDKDVKAFTDPNNAIFEQANLRYLSLQLHFRARRLVSLCSLLWNLQTLVIDYFNHREMAKIASKIWEMPLLRHVMLTDSLLPDPPNGEHNYVLENLQTLKKVRNLKFSEELVKRIPNVKKLGVYYDETAVDEVMPNFCLNNLGRLQKLDSLSLFFYYCKTKQIIRRSLVSFPHSLRKLILCDTRLTWEELTTTIGPLPLLQFLKLDWDACVGPTWETIEGQFCSLRVLHIWSCEDLKYWETDSAHFPRLEHLLLQHLYVLEEIPSSIGDIPTLESIRCNSCSTSAADSARRIKEEQDENENEDLQVVINKLTYQTAKRWDEEESEEED